MASWKRLSRLMTPSVLCRNFSGTPSLSAKYKTAKTLNKASTLLNRKISGAQKNKKAQWYDTPLGISAAGTYTVTKKKGPSEGMKRRAHQLSVVLSKYIFSLINSGELDPRLPDLGVEIVKVKLVPDLGVLHVHWLATGTNDDESIETILQEASYKLRTMLTGLGVMTSLPPVVFIKDLSQANFNKVQELLERADMGPDYEPTELGADMKSDIVLPRVVDVVSEEKLQDEMQTVSKRLLSLDLDMSDNIQTAPSLSEDPKSDQDLGLNLRSDIYNLDHASLIQKVIQTKRRKKNRTLEISEPSEKGTRKVMSDLTKHDIQKFLAARKSKKKINLNTLLASDLHQTDKNDYDDDQGGFIEVEEFENIDDMDYDKMYEK